MKQVQEKFSLTHAVKRRWITLISNRLTACHQVLRRGPWLVTNWFFLHGQRLLDSKIAWIMLLKKSMPFVCTRSALFVHVQHTHKQFRQLLQGRQRHMRWCHCLLVVVLILPAMQPRPVDKKAGELWNNCNSLHYCNCLRWERRYRGYYVKYAMPINRYRIDGFIFVWSGF